MILCIFYHNKNEVSSLATFVPIPGPPRGTPSSLLLGVFLLPLTHTHHHSAAFLLVYVCLHIFSLSPNRLGCALTNPHVSRTQQSTWRIVGAQRSVFQK